MSTPISSASTASSAASPSTVISSQGVGSGLDIAAIVTSLTSAKAAPLTYLQATGNPGERETDRPVHAGHHEQGLKKGRV